MLFGGDVNQAGMQFVELLFVRLKLSQALAAIGSPSASGELDY